MSKRALCIGINDYPGTDSDLSGCVNDAEDWAAMLGARGFEVSKLIDSEATKAAMVTAIRDLVGGAKKGDSVVVTYSGHGTWVPDDSGDEPDGRDEALCPYDIGAGNALLDDEIHELFSARAAGVRVLLISDSCHSGSVTRGSEEDLDPGMPRARFLPPEAWMPRNQLPRSLLARPLGLFSGFTRSGGDLLLAGCLDTEYSWDTRFGGRPNGAFTYYALKSLKTLPEGASYAQWFKTIRDYLPSTKLPQNPQLFGSRSARNFKVFS
ncbi:MAG: caspase family protein [Zoogloeaceae bacterium]|nr:caspase family protein [Zoogloeaceae bacterium]MCP5240378.1 caspase family protein [Zoogloeaceae bacterium]MCP5253511.1 caspase family protein [Zoogloeaceae bacterium]MCP5294952.1 caspase family protein [Zoogloeaceae bacterium]MCW5616224.1 caspase family protein [Rhodocyclaceae bacterium]